MKKFNGFETRLLEEGLKMYVDIIVDDIISMEQKGKTPLMTTGYVRSIEAEILTKLKSLTLKQK